MSSNPQPWLLCPDWVFSNNSNAHAAKDRAWFSTYTTFPSVATDFMGNECIVEGIGTIDLPTKRSPNSTGPSSHATIRLKNVLHIPSILCNVIGSPIMDDYEIITRFDETSRGSITDLDGQQVAYFDPSAPRFQVKLSDPPVGPALAPPSLQPNGVYMIHVIWPDSEKARWETRPVSKESYTLEETQWLKTHYGNEFKFLQTHGLSIYKDEDREEGRAIVRALMRQPDS